MTTKMPPGAPKLEMDGEPVAEEGDTLADSAWEGLDDPTADEKTQANLGNIARARKAKSGTTRAKG